MCVFLFFTGVVHPLPPRDSHHPRFSHAPPMDGYGYPHDPYHMTSTYQLPPVQPTPLPPPDLQSIIEKTAVYVAKNGEGFESTVIKRHLDDPRFGFLNPWGQYYSYYLDRKLYLNSCKQPPQTKHQPYQTEMYQPPRAEMYYQPPRGAVYQPPQAEMYLPSQTEVYQPPQTEVYLPSHEPPISVPVEKPSVQKLSSSGTVSFRVQSKPVPSKLLSEGGHFEEESTVESVSEPPKKKARVESIGMGSTVQVNLIKLCVYLHKADCMACVCVWTYCWICNDNAVTKILV